MTAAHVDRTLQAEPKSVLHCNRFQMVLENIKTQAPREIGQPWREDTSGCCPVVEMFYFNQEGLTQMLWCKKFSFST